MDELVCGQSSCGRLLFQVSAGSVAKVHVRLFMLCRAPSLDLAEVLVEPDGVVSVGGCGAAVCELGEVQDNVVPALT